ncbi:DUF4280 domain-containing protein [Corticibacter populi]|uniref:DUF4280 domain-containing protein n=1 Tax=Corticibacter populi TaxID=1550736 RepID=A0A3M6QNB1_9BURK|nr:DUF4280 domain-containing protein [Corticibacter populi]RMX04231.1 DUF4280 domain-containing protein [Corticibacter populi]RZS33267.1 uncharacterized protein DUF4280 [Corticibacter populi]
MPMQVVNTAMLRCSFGAAPGFLSVLPVHRTTAGGQPAANVLDHQPLVNIPAFGMCACPANPAVASATAAALGVLTPMPCVPVTIAPWQPGSPTVLIDRMPALNDTSCCLCTWGGVVSVAAPGQVTVRIP